MASVEKWTPDPKTGRARWRARWRDPEGRSQSKVFARKGAAARHLAEIEHRKLTGGYVDPAAGKVTFKSYAEQWRAGQVHRPGTTQSVEQQLRRHVYPTLGKRPIAAVRPSEIQTLVTLLATELAPSTVEVIYGRVVAVFRSAMRDRVITFTPCVDVRLPPKPPQRALEVLTTEQVVAVADAVPARYRALVLTGAGTGLRPGELAGLTLDHIDFLRRTIRVDQQLVRTRSAGGVVLAAPKTPASYRTVPLPATVADVLAAHLAQCPPSAELGLVFTNGRGAPVQERTFRSVWASARDRVGLPTWATPHDLRHYYASVLIRSGASVKVVQQRLGHSSAKTTLDTYAHIWPDDEDRTRAAIDAVLAGACHPGGTAVANEAKPQVSAYRS